MSPTPAEISARESLIKRVRDVVTKLWSGAKVDVLIISFHSIITFPLCANSYNYKHRYMIPDV